MRALKKRLEKIERVKAPKQAEPIVITRTIVAADGTEVGVVQRKVHR
jgi:hypothetical protein